MTVKIIGVCPRVRTYRIDCPSCHSLLQYEESDLRGEPDDGHVTCPMCSQPVYHLLAERVTHLSA